MYRCEARSVEGFIQQLAVSYVGHGFWFYVAGRVPPGKDASRIDAKLMSRYGVNISKWARARRKAAGLANVHYLRFGDFWVLLASKGRHPFFQHEARIRDIREQPLTFDGYCISYKRGSDGNWHPSIRLHPSKYRELKAYFVGLASHRSAENLWREFDALHLVPYAPIRRQLLNLLRAVNRVRRDAGFEPLPTSVLRLRKWSIRTFETHHVDSALPDALVGYSPKTEPVRCNSFGGHGRQVATHRPESSGIVTGGTGCEGGCRPELHFRD